MRFYKTKGFWQFIAIIFLCWTVCYLSAGISAKNSEELYKDLKNQNIILDQVKQEKVQVESQIENKNITINELQIQYAELSQRNAALENKVKSLMSVGTKPQNYKEPPTVDRGSFDRHKDNLVYEGVWEGTCYTPSKIECGNDKGITASGVPVMSGYTIAIDPKYWKFGTKFYIEGVGEVIATDSGSAIKGKQRFDLCMFNLEYAKQGSFKAKVWRIVE